MKIDIHSHLLNPNYDFNKLKNFYEILLLKHLGIKSFDEFSAKIKRDINNSDIDKAVLIGIELMKMTKGAMLLMNYLKNMKLLKCQYK